MSFHLCSCHFSDLENLPGDPKIEYTARMVKSPFIDKKDWFSPPFDPRFPNTNQTKNCYQNYIDFQRCKKKRGEDFSSCQYFKKVFQQLCPNSWKEKWDEQIEAGTFPGRI